MGIFRKNRQKFDDFCDFHGLIFTCVILLFDFTIFVVNFASISRLRGHEIGKSKICPTRVYFGGSKNPLHADFSNRNVTYTGTFRPSKSGSTRSRFRRSKCVLHGHISRLRKIAKRDFSNFTVLRQVF